MLRTIVVRNENVLRGHLQRVIKGDLVRCLSYECMKKLPSQRYDSVFFSYLFHLCLYNRK